MQQKGQMLPKKPKTHIMNTSKDKIYKVNTGRQIKSSIIYMKNLLNQYEKVNKNKEGKTSWANARVKLQSQVHIELSVQVLS